MTLTSFGAVTHSCHQTLIGHFVVNGALHGDDARHRRHIQARIVGVPQIVLVRDVVRPGGSSMVRPVVPGLAQVNAARAVVKGVGGGDAVFFDNLASWPSVISADLIWPGVQVGMQRT